MDTNIYFFLSCAWEGSCMCWSVAGSGVYLTVNTLNHSLALLDITIQGLQQLIVKIINISFDK